MCKEGCVHGSLGICTPVHAACSTVSGECYLEVDQLGPEANGELLDVDVLEPSSEKVASLVDGDDGCQHETRLHGA